MRRCNHDYRPLYYRPADDDADGCVAYFLGRFGEFRVCANCDQVQQVSHGRTRSGEPNWRTLDAEYATERREAAREWNRKVQKPFDVAWFDRVFS